MKKTLTIILICISLVGYSQSNSKTENCDYWKNEVDEFTGYIKKYTKPTSIGRMIFARLNCELRLFDDTYFMIVKYSGDLGCITNDSYIMFKLKNGDIVKINHFGHIDCGSNVPLYFYLDKEDIDVLISSEISKIRVSGSDYYKDIAVIKPSYFIQNIKCIYND